MKSLLTIVFLATILPAMAQFKVSPDGHYLLRDGKPFYWLGDTGWELFHRLDREQADQYLRRRSEQGFTVIQAVALAEMDGLHTPNPYGDLPLVNDDPTRPNEAYFKHVDYIIDKAAEYGLVIALLPTWGDKVTLLMGKGPLVFTPANAGVYGRWIGSRYKERKNIIWVLGGDRNPLNDGQRQIWQSMAEGIIQGVGGKDRALLSYHPQPNEQGSAEFFYKEGWFSFNMLQNGHCRDLPVYDNVTGSYDRQPVKPVLDAESLYEDHPVCFNVRDLGTSSAYDVRRYAYLDVFAGAFGNTYGCHDIWQFFSKDREPVNGPHMFWQEAMELPGANQMQFLRKLIESHPMTARIPDQSVITENALPSFQRIQATRGADFIMVYSSEGLPFTVNLKKISGNSFKTYWYDPRTGKTKEPEVIKSKEPHKFSPPSTGYGKDWVLVIDAEKKI